MATGKYHYITDGGNDYHEYYDFRIAKREARKMAVEIKKVAYLYTVYPSGRIDCYDVQQTGEVLAQGGIGPFNN